MKIFGKEIRTFFFLLEKSKTQTAFAFLSTAVTPQLCRTV